MLDLDGDRGFLVAHSWGEAGDASDDGAVTGVDDNPRSYTCPSRGVDKLSG